jgi:NMD protein affecting ribosome stability and mRNA decay
MRGPKPDPNICCECGQPAEPRSSPPVCKDCLAEVKAMLVASKADMKARKEAS